MVRVIAALPASTSTSRALALAALLLAAAAVCAAPPAAGATKIYRTVDEHGNVVFTDVPPKEGEQGRAVDLDAPNSFEPPPAAAEGAPDGASSLESWLGEEEESAEGETGSAGGYTQLRIVTPAQDETLRDNAGNVTVIATVEPDLRADHRVQLYLDGALRATGEAASFQLANVDRGTHAVEVRIVDQAGNTLAASPPTAFHLQRRSVLLQPARKPAPK